MSVINLKKVYCLAYFEKSKFIKPIILLNFVKFEIENPMNMITIISIFKTLKADYTFYISTDVLYVIAFFKIA